MVTISLWRIGVFVDDALMVHDVNDTAEYQRDSEYAINYNGTS